MGGMWFGVAPRTDTKKMTFLKESPVSGIHLGSIGNIIGGTYMTIQ